MGYYSTISGSFRLAKVASMELSKELSDLFSQGQSPWVLSDDRQHIVPRTDGEMKCYYWREYVYEALQMCKRHGVRVYGFVVRHGENGEDVEKMLVIRGWNLSTTQATLSFLPKDSKVFHYNENWRMVQ